MIRRSLLAPLAVLALNACNAGEQPLVSATREVDVGTTYQGLGAVERALQHVDARSMQLGLSRGGLQARAVLADDTGAEHVRFDRTYQGLRVLGGDVVVHSDALGAFDGLSGLGVRLEGLKLSPTLDAGAATLRAEAVFEGTRSGAAGAELLITTRGERPALAYEVTLEGVRADGTPSELHVLVDAHSGAIQEKWDAVHTSAATGTGYSLYEGTVSIGTNSISGGFEMRDVTRGKGFYTTDMNGRQSGNGTIFTDADNVWGSGTTSDVASAAVDAHYGQMKTYDYYSSVHGRNGIDGAGGVGFSRVHYGRRYNNAFWSDSCFCMTYGDGDGSQFTPLTALDVAGHEMSHGVTSRSANLTYSGESGGLNEATSDIFGTMVEWYASNPNDPGDYLIGEEIYTPSKAGDALRYMYKPSLDGSSKDCWSSTLGSLDVHYSSGPANHFFYLLAEGSSPAGGPASPTCNGSSVTGVGRDAAQKIWYRALTTYMTSSTNYAGARTATLKAATDLYGSGSAQYNAVAAAWSAVSVN